MFKNYFKIAVAVLQRRKFFTFISLFVISFTLTILLVLASFIDNVVNNPYPDKKRDRLLYLNRMQEKGPQTSNSGPLSFHFLDQFAGKLKTPEKVAISSTYSSTNTYVNNRKITINFKYTNAEFWEVLDFDFIEGKPFTRQQIASGEKVTVISEQMKKEYFGDIPSAVGKYMEADNEQYRVTGVVRSVPVTLYMLYGDIYLPYTVSKTDYKGNKSYRGDYTGILMAASKDDVPKMKQEYEEMVSRLPMTSKDFDHVYSHADPFITGYVRTGNEELSGVTIALTALTIFILLVMLLPTLNLVNINVTRIMERSSEIGVRKAFGASSQTLVFQFVIENLILTLLGGIISVFFAIIILQILNDAQLITNLHLSLNLNVLFIGLLTCLLFGLLSGVYPAWRMSRLPVVTALKSA